MSEITIPSSAVAMHSDQSLTPAMVSVVWEMAAALDERRVPAEMSNSKWLEMPTKRLRGEGARPDNVWLRECLTRLTGVTITGEHNGEPWGAVLLAQWHITEGGTMVKLLVPPLGVQVMRSPKTFTKIETRAAHTLRGHGRRLYAILADKRRLKRPYWVFSLDEIKTLMDVKHLKAYDRWSNFKKYVLENAIAAINDYGTVRVGMTPQKQGRSVVAVRFDWHWKDPHDATETASENERHSAARRKAQDTADAPPMIEDHEQADPSLTWWYGLTDAERNDWGERIGRTFKAGGQTYPRREVDIAQAAYRETSTDA